MSTALEDLEAAKAKVLHDVLMLVRPSGTDHKCGLCDVIRDEEEPVAFNEEDMTKAVATAVAEAIAAKDVEIANLKATMDKKDSDDTLATAVAEAVAEKDKQIADLEAEAEKHSIAAKAAEDKLAETVTYLEAEAETAQVESRREERLAAVKERGIHTDEFFTDERAAKWAAMSDEAWTDQLAEYDAIKPGKPAGNGPLPEHRSDAVVDGLETDGAAKSPRRAVMDLAAGAAAMSTAN